MPSPFTLPISTGGSFECTIPGENIYLLTFNSPPDNRLTIPFIEAFLLALDIVDQRYPKGVLITTSGIAKFYSNGLNLQQVLETPGFWDKYLWPLFRRLLTYPMPTVALVNGHAFAGGLMTAMYHDYRIQNPSKGFLCLNEIDFGAPLQPAMSSIFRQKVTPTTYRSLVLEGKRFGGRDALQAVLVDALGGLEAALSFIAERKLTAKGRSGVYGAMKKEMYRETLGLLLEEGQDKLKEQIEAVGTKDEEEAQSRLDGWESSRRSSKL